jgi:iron complex outermembrane receptor protein
LFKTTPFIFCIAVATPLAASQPLLAQATVDTTIALPPAVVEGERDREPAVQSIRLTRIESGDLTTMPIRSVADAIDQTSTAHIVRLGPTGFAGASIRGTGTRHTSIYLDGLLVSDPQSNQLDLGIIPVVMLESIEIEHGPSSASDGSGSLGGSVKLTTLARGEEPNVRMGFEAGEFGHRRIGVAATGSAGQLSLTAAGEISRYEGDYPYSNPTLIGSREGIRSDADRSLSALYGSAEYQSRRHSVSAAAWINSVERGLPGPANAPPSKARQWDDNTRLWLKSEHSFGVWKANVSAAAASSSLRYENADTNSRDTTRTHTFDVRAATGRPFSPVLLANAGLKLGMDRTRDHRELRAALFADATYENGRLLLFPSLRFEVWTADAFRRSAFVPRLGTNVRLDRSGRLHLKANVARAYRMPSFLERYWEPGGNPSLLPERGWSSDMGIHFRNGVGSAVEAELGIFFTDLDNKIVWQPSFVGSGLQLWRPLNVGRVATYGAEVSGNGRFGSGPSVVELGVAATWSSAVDLSEKGTPSYGKQLRYTPWLTSTVHAGLTVDAFSSRLTGRYTGNRFLTSDEQMALDGYILFDLQLGCRLPVRHASASLYLHVDNVFDTRYEVIRFYPMPPRSFSIRLNIGSGG